ncbi:efflux transporter outer membrane subunit [Zwartia sp.]|uniref:efflux transporter outer membrane subunit n=1 Tax=Zwartia sp. TaxID=2978004 RepID=UPI0027233AA0|nr:efflux transporter outer membrane subunit [Zwartia sp.]MDO9026107.1 efflux transporter outer membrane subunit [Zwartia sp.]
MPVSKYLVFPLLLLLAGCITLGPDYDRQQSTSWQTEPTVWQQPLPHDGNPAVLVAWWAQFKDPVLLELVDQAQKQSNSMAQAALRIAQARALLVTVDAAAIPNLNAAGSLTRGTYQLGGPVIVATTIQAQLQAGWEIDLFGGLARASEAARARLEAQVANWHEARISVSADTASLYTNYRSCEQLVLLTRADANSRAQTARLTQELAQTGFQAPANAALARASAAEGQGRAVGQRAECDLLVKALVSLTGLTETALRASLDAGSKDLPKPAMPVVQQVPAQVLLQRPDVAAAERELAAASADIGVREADRYPRLSLLGNVGPLSFESGVGSISATSWSIGPTLSLPIFDAGRRAANLETAKVAYDVAATNYRTQARRAVREVEEALVRLDSLNKRETEAVTASTGYRTSLQAAQDRYKFGLASILDLEETRRLSFNADNVLALVRRDRVNAYIALYRAVGGGWNADDVAAVQRVMQQQPNQVQTGKLSQ